MNAGELSPLLGARVDFQKYPSGASIMEGFIPTVQGPIERRGGTRFVHEVKDSAAGRCLLQPFEFSVDQAYMLEFGHQYVRFYTWDALTKVRGILESSPGVPVEVVTPYAIADLYNNDGTPKLRFAQSGDFLYIAHPNYQQRVLKRTTATTFTIETFNPVGGPWMDLQTALNNGARITASGQTGTVTLDADKDIFLPGHVGSLIYLENNDISSIQAWEVSKTIVVGDRRRSDNKTYEATVAGTTGTSRPVHTEGEFNDGSPGVRWAYRDSGYGYAKITAYSSARSVTAVVVDRLPTDNTVVTTGTTRNIIDVNVTFQTLITTSVAHGYSVGDVVVIRNSAVPAINGTHTVTTISSATIFGIANVAGAVSSTADAGTATTFTSGTYAIVGTQRWAFGEWSDVNGWPTDVAFFRERLWWGRKQKAWGSVAADFNDYHPKSFGTVTDDMAISVQLVSGKINDIQWMIGDEELLCGTAGGEFTVGELTNGDPIGPGNVRVKPISFYGSRAIPPIKNGDATLFIQRSGLKAREVTYDTISYKYKSSDATVLAEHVTASGVLQMAMAQEPNQVVWGTRADGVLIGFTWNAEQEVRGWHRQPIGGNGFVEAIGAMPAAEGDRDELWLIVRRTIDGATKRYVEYMERPYRPGDAQSSQFYVDSGLTYNGSPTTTISGLSHLEGMTVDILGDGAPQPQRVVTGGEITLQRAASVVQIGLPCPCKYRSMRIEAGARDGTAQGKTKRTHKMVMRFLNTGGGRYGSREDNMDDINFRTTADAMGQAVPLFSGDKVVQWPEGYTTDMYMMYENEQPTAVTLLALMPQVDTQDAR